MSRPQPRTARPWLSRALLVLFTLTGLGIWQGGHCGDHRPAPVTPKVVAGAAVSTHHVGFTADPHCVGTPAADPCDIVSTTITTTTVAATSVPPTADRVAAASPRPRCLTPCSSPGVALTRLGVSRT